MTLLGHVYTSSKTHDRQALEGAILSRYEPESMLLRRQLETDDHFRLALNILRDRPRYDALLDGPTVTPLPPTVPGAAAPVLEAA